MELPVESVVVNVTMTAFGMQNSLQAREQVIVRSVGSIYVDGGALVIAERQVGSMLHTNIVSYAPGMWSTFSIEDEYDND